MSNIYVDINGVFGVKPCLSFFVVPVIRPALARAL